MTEKTPKKYPKMTAEQWLEGPGMGFLSRDLAEEEKTFPVSTTSAEIQSALFAKGANPRDN